MREEVLHKTEVINQGQTTDRDLETDTGHMAMSVTIRMLLHIEVETGEVPPHTTQEEGIKVTTMTSSHVHDLVRIFRQREFCPIFSVSANPNTRSSS